MKQILLYNHLDFSWFNLFVNRVHQVKADKMDFQETQLVSHLWMIMEIKIILPRSLDTIFKKPIQSRGVNLRATVVISVSAFAWNWPASGTVAIREILAFIECYVLYLLTFKPILAKSRDSKLMVTKVSWIIRKISTKHLPITQDLIFKLPRLTVHH